jgi:pilus assembly protein TadC
MKHRLLCFLLGILIAIVADALLYLSFSIGCKSFDIWSWSDEAAGGFAVCFFCISAFSLVFTQFIEKQKP